MRRVVLIPRIFVLRLARLASFCLAYAGSSISAIMTDRGRSGNPKNEIHGTHNNFYNKTLDRVKEPKKLKKNHILSKKSANQAF